MNLLAHFYLADRTGTSSAGQILGDIVKGRLDGRYPAHVREGIRLHRAIDSFSDAHTAHRTMRRAFEPPLRRYAGILVDIGFDYSLARFWSMYDERPLNEFAAFAEQRVRHQWPVEAPFTANRLRGLAATLTGYARPSGIQQALTSVSRRLSRRNPVADALPAILKLAPEFDARLSTLLDALTRFCERPERTMAR